MSRFLNCQWLVYPTSIANFYSHTLWAPLANIHSSASQIHSSASQISNLHVTRWPLPPSIWLSTPMKVLEGTSRIKEREKGGSFKIYNPFILLNPTCALLPSLLSLPNADSMSMSLISICFLDNTLNAYALLSFLSNPSSITWPPRHVPPAFSGFAPV